VARKKKNKNKSKKLFEKLLPFSLGENIWHFLFSPAEIFFLKFPKEFQMTASKYFFFFFGIPFPLDLANEKKIPIKNVIFPCEISRSKSADITRLRDVDLGLVLFFVIFFLLFRMN
jgi:hypothetical protein